MCSDDHDDADDSRLTTLPIDLVPKEVTMAWLKYLREELPTVAFKCSTQQQATNLGQRRGKHGKAAAAAEASGAALGGEQLLQLLKNYARNKDIKTAITVGRHMMHDDN